VVFLDTARTDELGDKVLSRGSQANAGRSSRPHGYYGNNTSNVITATQIDALLHLVEALKSVFVIERFGGHREFPGQDNDGKIRPGNIGMKLVRNIRTQTQILPPPRAVAE